MTSAIWRNRLFSCGFEEPAECMTPEPIGPVIDRLRDILHYLDGPGIQQKDRNSTLLFRFVTEVEPVIKFDIELATAITQKLCAVPSGIL